MMRVTSLRNVVSRARSSAQVKMMSGGHAPKDVTKSGIEGFVAKYLPENHQLSMAILGFWGSLAFAGVTLSSGTKKQAPDAHHAPAATTGAIPSFLDSPDAFFQWLEVPGNIEILVKTAE